MKKASGYMLIQLENIRIPWRYFKSRMSKGILGTPVWLVVKGACYWVSRATLITGNKKGMYYASYILMW